MAAELQVTPGQPKVGDTLRVDGTGFAPSGNIEILVPEAGLTLYVKANADGSFKGDKTFRWTPTRIGDFTVRASDGTNTAEQILRIWS